MKARDLVALLVDVIGRNGIDVEVEVHFNNFDVGSTDLLGKIVGVSEPSRQCREAILKVEAWS